MVVVYRTRVSLSGTHVRIPRVGPHRKRRYQKPAKSWWQEAADV